MGAFVAAFQRSPTGQAYTSNFRARKFRAIRRLDKEPSTPSPLPADDGACAASRTLHNDASGRKPPLFFFHTSVLTLSTGKNVSFLAASASRVAIHNVLSAKGNLADVTAKSGAQTILACTLGEPPVQPVPPACLLQFFFCRLVFDIFLAACGMILRAGLALKKNGVLNALCSLGQSHGKH